MVERLNNNEGMNHDDLAKLKQDVLSSLEQYKEPDIRRELEEVKRTLENTNLSDQEKLDQIKDELTSLKEKGVVLNYLNDLEHRVDTMLQIESSKNNSGDTQKLLEQISSLPNSPGKDAQIKAVADIGRAKSSDSIVQEIDSMKKSKGVRGMIGNFFSSRV